MDKSHRSQEHIKKAFVRYCIKVLRNEAIDANKNNKRQTPHEVEVYIEDCPQIKKLQCTYDNYFSDGEEEPTKVYSVAGKMISSSMISEALECLSDECQNIILLYYFYKNTDSEIATMLNIPKSTVQYRRNHCIKFIKKYLEERTNEKKCQQ